MTVVTMDSSTGSAEDLDGVDEQLVRQLADRARAEGLRLTGEGGLLARVTKLAMRRPSPDFAAAETCRADDHIQAVREERSDRRSCW